MFGYGHYRIKRRKKRKLVDNILITLRTTIAIVNEYKQVCMHVELFAVAKRITCWRHVANEKINRC